LSQQEVVQDGVMQRHHTGPFQRAPVNFGVQRVIAQVVDATSRGPGGHVRRQIHTPVPPQLGQERAA